MNSGGGSVHILPIIVMFVGMLIVGAGILGEFDGPRPLRGNGTVFLVAIGLVVIIGGALLL